MKSGAQGEGLETRQQQTSRFHPAAHSVLRASRELPCVSVTVVWCGVVCQFSMGKHQKSKRPMAGAPHSSFTDSGRRTSQSRIELHTALILAIKHRVYHSCTFCLIVLRGIGFSKMTFSYGSDEEEGSTTSVLCPSCAQTHCFCNRGLLTNSPPADAGTPPPCLLWHRSQLQ